MSLSKLKRFTRRTGLSFYTKITFFNGEVISRQSSKKTKIYNFLKANSAKFEVIYILVTYKPGITNEGEYKKGQWDELMNAWLSFTEEGLIKDALQY